MSKPKIELVELNLEVVIKKIITHDDIAGLLCSLFEDGYRMSYIDYTFCEPNYGEGVAEADLQKGGRYYDEDWSNHPLYMLPLIPGCSVSFRVLDKNDEDKYVIFELNRLAIEQGLKALEEKYPHHWKDFVTENTDINTGDAFLQCCLYGEIVYD